MRKPYREDLRAQYRNQKWYNHAREIPFLLTFEEWLKIWKSSGHLHQRGGRDPNDYCMARGTPENPDIGAYEVENVRIVTNRQNRKEQNNSYLLGNKHAFGVKHSKEWRRKASERNMRNIHAAKLTPAKVRKIRKLKNKLSLKEIAVKFGVSKYTIYDIFYRNSWSSVD